MALVVALPVSAVSMIHQLPTTQRQPPTIQRHATTLPRVIHVRWTAPQPGWYKLNTDGFVLHDGSSWVTISGVIRDCTGRVVAAFAERTPHAPIGIVEARTMLRGLELVEADDFTLVQLLRGESRQTRISRGMEEDVLEMLGRFRGGCKVQHAYREGNQVVDALCREAYQCSGVWIDQMVLFHVYEKVEDDCHSVAHDRIVPV